MNREPIPAWVSDYVGIPWLEHGRTREGADCWGVLWVVDQERFHFGIPRLEGAYPDDYELGAISALLDRGVTVLARPIEAGRERLGNMVVLRYAGFPCHVGLVLGDRKMLHTRRGIGSMVEAYDSPIWRHKVLGFYEWAR